MFAAPKSAIWTFVAPLAPRSVLFAALAFSVACGASTIEPQPSDAVIGLDTSGGFAGVDFAFAVDGPAGVIRGVRCVNFCDWEDGDVLATVSSAEVAALESRFDAIDFLAGDDQDFGVQCCDQFHYELTFSRSDASRTVMGSSEKLPAEILALIRDVEEWVASEREDNAQ